MKLILHFYFSFASDNPIRHLSNPNLLALHEHVMFVFSEFVCVCEGEGEREFSAEKTYSSSFKETANSNVRMP